MEEVVGNARAKTTAAGKTLAAPERSGFLLAALSGSAAVAIVGLSQILAVGALSVTALGRDALAGGVVAAFVSATIGALCVALLSRMPGEICGPRTSIAVIYAALCADLIVRAGPNAGVADIWAALSLAVMLMGILQIAAGWIRLGDAIKFMPYPVNAGFVTGIGLLIIWSQAAPLLGLEGRLTSYKWDGIVGALKPASILIAGVTMSTIWLLPLVTKRGQPLLVGLAAGTLLYHVVAHFLGAAALGPTLGTIHPVGAAEVNLGRLWEQRDASWLLGTSLYVLPYAAFLALQGIMNAAVSSVALSDVTGMRANVNRALITQGIGNILCGGLAALPIGTSPSQSMVAGRMTSVRSVVPLASPVLLLMAVLLLGPVLAYIPVAVLGGILITVGAGMIDRWARGVVMRALKGDMRREIVGNGAIVIAVAGAFIFGGVPVALVMGALLAMILLVMNLASATTFGGHVATDLASTRAWPAAHAAYLAQARSAVYVVRPRGGLFFGTAEQLADTLARLPDSIHYCIVDLSLLTTIDATGCQILNASAKKLAKRGITLSIAGIAPGDATGKSMHDLGLVVPDIAAWHIDLDHALESVEAAILREHGIDPTDSEVLPLADTVVAKDLTPEELRVLRERTHTAEHVAGEVLFRTGEPGTSMYMVARGEVEIHSGESAASRSRRLAAFGPGAAFGEIALIAGGERTADAICTKDSVLYEFSRDALLWFEREAPHTYAKMMRNLNLNLASRLVIATEIVRGRR